MDQALPLDPGDTAGKRRRVWCRDCGRPLTSDESRRVGRGADCQAKHDPRPTPRAEQHHVEQDTLPGT